MMPYLANGSSGRTTLPDARSTVDLVMPADRRYVAKARDCAGQVARRAGLGFRQTEDFKLAADEACTLVLSAAAWTAIGSELECRFAESDGAVAVTASVLIGSDHVPMIRTLGWSILDALAYELWWFEDGVRVGVHITMPAPRTGR